MAWLKQKVSTVTSKQNCIKGQKMVNEGKATNLFQMIQVRTGLPDHDQTPPLLASGVQHSPLLPLLPIALRELVLMSCS